MGENSGEDREEDNLGEDNKSSLGNGSSARDASTSGDDESLGGGVDETTKAEEDGSGW